MALASGTPVPPVYVMSNEQGINAFAAGTTPQNAVIGVTRGAIETLSRDELQGVIAHEFSHILNGDMKINLRLIGLLHGILVIAMIGYLIFRFTAQLPRFSSSDDDGKATLGIIAVLFALGGALVGIGYVGVFFASLLQSAVSRQREFLADASAVQFTRNPNGISDALKNIGGWKQKSIVRAVYSRETCHMFFSQGMVAQWFSTHPALDVRIRRIEPNFDGRFPATTRIVHTEREIIDPSSLSKLRSSFATAHQAALDGVERFESVPREAVQHVGQPVDEHIDQAKRLVGDLDPGIMDEARDPLGAVAIVYAMLLAPADAPLRPKQLDMIQRFDGTRILGEMARVLGKIDTLEPEQRLPLACLCLPAIDQLSDSQSGTFRTTVRQLIDADRRWTIFEFAIQRFITKRLVHRAAPTAKSNASKREIDNAFGLVLSMLAYMGGEPEDAKRPFQAGLQSCGRSHLVLLEREQCTLKRLDESLDVMGSATGKSKREMLNAFCVCVAEDSRSTIREVELLRVISDALGCPMPPVLNLSRG
jgi:Zn-dependent protease with chaperone function